MPILILGLKREFWTGPRRGYGFRSLLRALSPSRDTANRVTCATISPPLAPDMFILGSSTQVTKVHLERAMVVLGPSRWLSSKESSRSAGDTAPIPGSGRSPGEGNGNPPQYSCLENPMDRAAWRAAVHGVTEGLI